MENGKLTNQLVKTVEAESALCTGENGSVQFIDVSRIHLSNHPAVRYLKIYNDIAKVRHIIPLGLFIDIYMG